MNAHRVRLEPAALAVEPGHEVTCTVRITNIGDVVDAFDVVVLGAPAAWTAVEPTTVSLFPGAEGVARLTFRPPRSPDVPAGATPFGVRVQSQDAKWQTSVVEEGTLEVGPFADLAADLKPRTSHGSIAGRHRVELTNRGNALSQVRLSASDPDQALNFVVPAGPVPIRPGGAASVRVRARLAGLSLTGPPRQWPFKVVAEADGAPPIELNGAVEQLPLLSRWVRRGLVIGAIALVGLAVYAAKGQELRMVLDTTLSGSHPVQSPSSGAGSTPSTSTTDGSKASSPTPSAGGGAASPSPSAGSGTSTSRAPATVIGSSPVAPGSFNSVRVMCPAGTQAVSGGIDPANVLTVKVTSSAPIYADNNNRLIFRSDGPNPAAVGWQVSAKNDDSAAQTIRAAVVCAGAYIGNTSTLVTTSSNFGAGNFGVVAAICPAGSVALGGGADLDNVFTMAVTSSAPTFGGTRLLLTASGRNPAPNGWQATARNDSSTSMKFKVAVICSTAAAGRTTAVVAGAQPASPGSFASARLPCPSGSATVGGGVDTGNVIRMTVTSSAPVFPDPNARTLFRSDGADQAPVGWQVSARNDDSAAQATSIAVICTTP